MKYFTLSELCHSDYAEARHMANTPGRAEEENLRRLVANVLDPLRELYGRPVYVNSGYRSPMLNTLLGGAPSSQHVLGQAADIRARDLTDNARLFRIIADHLPFDQLIWEKGTVAYPKWIHVSWAPALRHQVLRWNGRFYVRIA